MGLAASQGRYLGLTARKNDLIYEGQQISQQRLNLAKMSEAASEKYNEAMNNRLMQATTPDGKTQVLTYEILTSQDPFSGLCMRLVDLNGNVVVPKQGYSLDITQENADGIKFKTTVSSSQEFITKYMPDIDGDSAVDLASKSLPELAEYYQEHYPNSTASIEVRNHVNTNLKKEDERFLEDDNCLDSKYLHEMITTGQWIIQQADTSEEGWENVIWQGSSSLTEIYDESDNAAAEAEYETATKKFQREDKVLELRLEEVQTQEKAVSTEIDSIKDVIQKNIEGSFKTFA